MYTLNTLKAMFRGAGTVDSGGQRSSMRIHATVPTATAPYAVSGRVIGIGSKLGIQEDESHNLVEDIRPEWVTYAEVV